MAIIGVAIAAAVGLPAIAGTLINIGLAVGNQASTQIGCGGVLGHAFNFQAYPALLKGLAKFFGLHPVFFKTRLGRV